MFSQNNILLKIPALLYIFGLFIYNLHVSSYGYQSFEVVQPKYLIIGLTFIGYVTLSTCFLLIKVDLSWTANTFKPRNLFPWLLRISSFSYVIWIILYGINPFEYYANTPIDSIFEIHAYLSIIVVIFTINDLMGMMTVGDGLDQKITRSVIRIISIPATIICIFQASQEPGLESILIFNLSVFFALIGICISQIDRENGIKSVFLDENTEEEVQESMKIFISLISLVFLPIILCVMFTNTIYPKIPSYLGGPELSQAEIHSEGNVINSKILLINENWIVLIDKKSKMANKIRVDLVDKIIYK